MKIEDQIRVEVIKSVKKLYGKSVDEETISLQKTRKEFVGDITLVVFPLIKLSGKSPQETAEEIGEYLKTNLEEVDGFNVVKGFLNISFSNRWWINYFRELAVKKDFNLTITEPQRIMIEYPSPNTNKPLHLGHLRNIFLGSSVSAILTANGHEVIHTCLYNDRGTNISKSMIAWLKWGNGETPESTGMKDDHLVGKYYVVFSDAYKKEIASLMDEGMTKEEAEKNSLLIKEVNDLTVKWEEGDPEVRKLWSTMNGWVYKGFEKTYSYLNISPDKYYYESDVYNLGKETVSEGLEKGVFYKKDDGSVWIDLTEDGLDEKLVLRNNGTTVYITQDIAVANEKEKDYKIDRSIYVVGNEQEYHFKVLFLILKKLGRSYADNLYHLSYGMVELPTGKMKSREGTVVDADDLIEDMIRKAGEVASERGKTDEMDEAEVKDLAEMVGMSGLRYYILKVDPRKKMIFNPEESIDLNGHTGPFIQYTHARIKSLLRKAESQNFTPGRIKYQEFSPEPAEKSVLRILKEYPAVIQEAGKSYDPSHLANYVYELAKEYNHFYQSFPPFLKEENLEARQFRLEVSLVTSRIIAHGMSLLGIRVPERM